MKETIHPHIEMLAMEQPIVAAMGLIACGILCCFFGYRTTNILIDVSGFIFVGMAALLIAGVVTQGNLLVMGLALILGGVIGAFLAHRIYRLGVMAFGGGVCALLAWHFSDALPAENWTLPVIVLTGLVGGILSLILKRFIISLVTAVLGSLFIVHGVFLMLSQFAIEPKLPELGETLSAVAPFLIAWAATAATGFLFQMLFAKDTRKR